jgi:hypothetical protein
VGHPFGIEQISCPGRPQPPVPDWHATAAHKLQVGLGDDMIGYIIPSPGWFADPAVVLDPSCPAGAQAQSDPTSDVDQHGQYHKLESESVGPDAGSLVAGALTGLLDAVTPQPEHILAGRFLLSSGAFTHKGADRPVGIWVLPAGTTALSPGTGTVVALAGINSFGSVPVNAHGVFMDYDGRPQPRADIDTRGMLVTGVDGTSIRYFTNVYPALTGAAPGAAGAGAATGPSGGPVVTPALDAGLPPTSGGPMAGWGGLALLLAALTLMVSGWWQRSRSRR